MTSPASSPPRPNPLIQTRLLQLAVGFVAIYAILLTFAPAVRLRSWTFTPNLWIWAGFVVWAAGIAILLRQSSRTSAAADPFLLPILALLSGWGLMEITRLSPSLGLRQTIWMGLGWLLIWFGLRLRGGLTYLRRYKYIWLTLGLLLTALTLIFGTYPGGGGPRLWLGCCGVYFQPSEPLKLLLIIYMAAYLADRLPVSLSLLGLLAPTFVLVVLALLLLVVQRDLGTATLLILVYTLTLYLSSGRRRMLLLCFAALLSAGFIGYTFSSVVHSRVDTWLNPWLAPSGESYQIVQSLIAVGSGGLIGRGPGLGSPGVVPVAVSDFIYPAIVEETGLIGAVGILLVFALLIARGLVIAVRAPINYHRYLAAGISAYFACQTILIIAGNIRLMPLTGVTLPFISYGGSSLLTSFGAVLILMLISRQSDQDPAPLSQAQPYQWFLGASTIGLVILALATGWYSIVRQDDLLSRADNPRRAIDERYVQRGALLDRHNLPITHSSGSPGTYQ
ncbi:MAG TPA: FtsW/RodA/SpoVE family cell cycle protein, partial [Anaerolinea sp.]|nr:FtsW/RodA/SpoVE family cell cycle protein [Anaerolinea sp.]